MWGAGVAQASPVGPDRFRRLFTWFAIAVVALSACTFPLVDRRLSANYRALWPLGSNDVLELAVGSGPQLRGAYGLPLALRERAPGAIVVEPEGQDAGEWMHVRLVGYGRASEIALAPGTARNWLADADVSSDVVASGTGSQYPDWAIALDPAGDHRRLALLIVAHGAGSRREYLLVETSLLPGFPRSTAIGGEGP